MQAVSQNEFPTAGVCMIQKKYKVNMKGNDQASDEYIYTYVHGSVFVYPWTRIR